MDLRRLRLFLAVVDEGGFTAAARAVHVAQPAVSLAVKELEEELGTPLLVRSRAGVALTAAGEALVPPVRQALRDVETAAAAVAAVRGLEGGRLDLASLPTLAADPLADLVGGFRRAHPSVQVRLAAPNELGEVADAVRSGAAEVGITEAGPHNGDLVEHPFVVQELLAVAPPGSPTGTRPLALRSLEHQPLVLSPPGASLRSVVDAGFAAEGCTPTVAVESEQRDALVPLVLAGAGTSFLPAALARSAEGLGAVVRRTTPPLRRTIALVRRDGPLSPAARAFLQEAGVSSRLLG
jgi:DNA-binding transcriptional LysR family regulator